MVAPAEVSGLMVAFETANGEILNTGADSFTNGRWTHLAGTWNDTVKRIFVDGMPVEEAGVAMDFDTRDLLIGADEDLPDLVIPFLGALDEIRIYGRELDGNEIAELAQGS